MSDADFETVRAIALDEMVGHVAGARNGFVRTAARAVLAVPASSIARTLVALDRDLATGTWRPSALSVLRRYGARVRVERDGFPLQPIERVPALLGGSGPLVVVANHPGLFDALALFAAIGRDDLATLAAKRPLFEALPHVRARLLSIEPGVGGGVALRMAVRHLQQGGALLHFPAGRIEPDPRVTPAGQPAIDDWKPGLDRFLACAARCCPDLRVVPVLVSGVISPRALSIARALRGPGELTGAVVPLLQLTLPGFRDVDVRVCAGQACSIADLAPSPSRRLREQLAAIAERVTSLSAGRAAPGATAPDGG